MTVTLTPEYDKTISPHYFYSAIMPDGTRKSSCGDSWEKARERILEAVRNHREAPPTPEPEEITL